MPRLALVLTLLLVAGSAWAEQPTVVEDHPLRVFDFYLGRLVPTEDFGMPWTSCMDLKSTVGGQALRFVGRWTRKDQPPEFVDGLIAWDPVGERIRISALFFHGAYFEGIVHVLDRDRSVVQRDWTGRYPDGRSAEYRETWTPVSEDTFEWKIEKRVEGEWQMHLAPNRDRPAVHRVEREVGPCDLEGQ